MINLRSDNCSAVHPKIREALLADLLQAADDGDSYDRVFEDRLNAAFSAVFGCEMVAVTTATGTGANVVSIASLRDESVAGAILCHPAAHVRCWEHDAVRRYTGAGELVTVDGPDGTMTPDALRETLARLGPRSAGGVLSLTNPTECGTLYTLEDLAALTRIAHEAGLRVHLDGARLGNSLCALGLSAAELIAAAPFDAISFGGTKVGALAAEAALFRAPSDAVRKRGQTHQRAFGQRQAKRRMVEVQLLRLIEDDLWLEIARQQNALCATFADGLQGQPPVRFRYPHPTNQLFLEPTDEILSAIRELNIRHTIWPDGSVRLVFGYDFEHKTVSDLAAKITEYFAETQI
ncbi:threonine aldolase family protein [Acuticoccus kandeliae]|uniref:threonine aldolase family protein n=1 Tax=Acuticoccus kandeliae TaxID=2073160 RepID=UPI000D3EC0FC|nr:beta-eliminating lyase-related protein [Acuticoccus kandeliae]